ncbi:MAG: aminotransferase class V-fold PLP-dependent enzyme [bacterium]
MRIVKSDDQGKMDMCDLERLIVADIAAGYTPFFIKNTAGTTVLGAFDPIDETAKIAQKYNIWLHVDAALGGTFLMSQKYKHLLQ